MIQKKNVNFLKSVFQTFEVCVPISPGSLKREKHKIKIVIRGNSVSWRADNRDFISTFYLGGITRKFTRILSYATRQYVTETMCVKLGNPLLELPRQLVS